MFFICWAPFYAQRLFSEYGQHLDSFQEIAELLFYVSGCLYYFSATVNPILYNFISPRYREAFKKTLCCAKSNVRKNIRCDFYETNKTVVNAL